MIGIWKLAQKFLGSSHDRHIQKLMPLVKKINDFEPKISQLSDSDLKKQTTIFKERLANKETLDDLLPEAYATVREAAKRVLGMRPFDVQLIGGIVLHQHSIAQMRTGEGKTLMSTMPVYLNALLGKGVHVVTVNDYLAKRDAEQMGHLYEFLGLSTGVITHDMANEERRKAYACDITYATNNELGFDYLRDNMVYDLNQMVQRGHYYAIIDEVDSILIDEARTPLIISGPLEDKTDLYKSIDAFIPKLASDDYEVDEKQRTAILTEIGTQKIEDMLIKANYLKGTNLYDAENAAIVHHVNNALKAHKIFARDKDYMVANGEVVIIDEFTGRMMPGRRYSEGLHQALEAKENLPIQPESQTLASITFQNYFRMYEKLSGMTGTATTEAEEFSNIYNLEVVAVPTNLPVQRIDDNDEIYCTAEEKYRAIVNEIKAAHAKEQPILVGTTSIEKSECLAKLLKKNNIKNFQVLNAKYHEQEARIISQAGVPGSITIATNMAGRGTDIQLGGSVQMRAETEISPNDTAEFKAKKLQEIEQDVAKRKEKALQAGGLYVLATERHESRRIDNQLRGRSGRQGDPGKSKFFLSLEDDLMRIFGSERMHFMLQKLGIKENEAITHPWISKALEKAQAKVEARNFDIRKNLLKYDDVMNDQRKVIFEQRFDVLKSDDLSDVITEMRQDAIDSVVTRYVTPGSYREAWDIEGLKQTLEKDFNLSLPLSQWRDEDGVDEEVLISRINNAVKEAVSKKEKDHGEELSRLFEKNLLLETIDTLWRNHLMNLEHLRSVVGFRGYAQRDPLNEYKTEAFMLFQSLLNDIRYDVTSKLMRFEITRPSIPAEQHMELIAPNLDNNIGFEDFANGQELTFDKNNPKSWGKIGRNELCPCNSGKKYKHCHGSFN